MLSTFRSLLVCLAVLAVGIAQVLGMPGGYLCGCTGQRSVEETCKVDDCHPSVAHQDGCVDSVGQAACGDHEEKAPVRVPHEHKHSEVRKALIVTSVAPTLALPAVVFFELPPAFQVPEGLTPRELSGRMARPAPPGHESPPMPLLVARTMVMLV